MDSNKRITEEEKTGNFRLFLLILVLTPIHLVFWSGIARIVHALATGRAGNINAENVAEYIMLPLFVLGFMLVYIGVSPLFFIFCSGLIIGISFMVWSFTRNLLTDRFRFHRPAAVQCATAAVLIAGFVLIMLIDDSFRFDRMDLGFFLFSFVIPVIVVLLSGYLAAKMALYNVDR